MWSLIPVLFIISHVGAAVTPTPVVLWHGMGDACCMPYSLGAVKEYLEKTIPGIYVNSIKIGESVVEDLENGYLMNPNKQVKIACKMLAADKNLSNGFNMVGFSQGCQFLRAVVQRCGHQLPPIRTLVSLGGQHQGVYGLPHCAAVSHKSCDYIRKLLNYAAYESWLQRSLVQATYWHDPLHEELYRNNSIFLADINNERFINKTYVKNLNSLEKFVLVMYENDTIVQPRETEWFGFYVPGQSRKLMTVQDSKVYDRLGLRKMQRDGKLVFISTPGDHLKMSWEWFNKNILEVYLKDKPEMDLNAVLKGKKENEHFLDERLARIFRKD